MKHKHLFKKSFEGNVLVSGKKAMEEVFGKLPPLPKGKKWTPIIQWETVYCCRCGKTQTFIDMKDGDYNKSLPKEFSI